MKRLERADGQCDLLRKALVTRVERAVQAPPAEDLLVVIARELSGVSTRLSDVASGHAAPAEAPAEAPAAPPVAGPAPAAPAAAAELEALDARSDALRAQLEDALLARSAPTGTPAARRRAATSSCSPGSTGSTPSPTASARPSGPAGTARSCGRSASGRRR